MTTEEHREDHLKKNKEVMVKENQEEGIQKIGGVKIDDNLAIDVEDTEMNVDKVPVEVTVDIPTGEMTMAELRGTEVVPEGWKI